MVLNIVLVEPQIPQNTGNIARTCAATGARLHLVGPMGFAVDDRKLKRAGLDYWHHLDINTYRDMDKFMGRHGADADRFYYLTTKGRRVYTDIPYPDNVFILFGREDAGLPEPLLAAHPDQSIRIPMRQGLRSLNLSNAAAVTTYEILRQWDFPQLQNQGNLTQFDWDGI